MPLIDVPESVLADVLAALGPHRRRAIRHLARSLGITRSAARQIVDGEVRIDYVHEGRTAPDRWRYLHRRGVMP